MGGPKFELALAFLVSFGCLVASPRAEEVVRRPRAGHSGRRSDERDCL